MTAPRLVAAGPRHAAVLAGLHGHCFSHPWDEAAFARLLALPTTHGLLAGLRPPLGFVLFALAADEAEILTIGVVPAARRRRLGRRLIGAAMREAAHSGARRMFLEVEQDNAAALALYRGLGFGTAGRRPDYYGPGRDAMLLVRELPPPAALRLF